MMKNLLCRIAVLLSLVALSSCKGDGVVIPDYDESTLEKYLDVASLNGETITLSANEAAQSIYLYSESKYTLSILYSDPALDVDDTIEPDKWCLLNEENRVFKNSEIPLIVVPNPYNTSRGGVWLSCESDSDELEDFVILVNQTAGATNLSYSTDEVVFGVGGGTVKLDVETNAFAWSVSFGAGDDSWVEVVDAQESYEGSQTITLSAGANMSSDGFRHEELIVTAFDEVSGKEITYPLALSQSNVLDAPVMDIEESYDYFYMKWKEVSGIDKYILTAKPVDGGDPIEVEISPEVNTNAYNVSCFDLSTLEYTANGKYEYSIMAYSGAAKQACEPVTLHNLFDVTSGDGTSETPYVISNARHLGNISTRLDKIGEYYSQIADIDLAEVDFMPISSSYDDNTSSYGGEFNGIYDAGKGEVIDEATGRTAEQYMISNMTINQPASCYCALFANVGASGVVRNIMMQSPSVTAKWYLSTIAAMSSGTITSCHNVGGAVITDSTDDADPVACGAYIGGIVGNMRGGSISYCNNGAVVTSYQRDMGGVVGVATIASDATELFTILRCTNSGAIYCGNNASAVGGIIGSANGFSTVEGVDRMLSIIESGNSGAVTVMKGNSSAGGIMGMCEGPETYIARCYNVGKVTGSVAGSAGGVVGRQNNQNAVNGVSIEDCYNAGEIHSQNTAVKGQKDNSGAGGIIALSSAKGLTTIVRCANYGVCSVAGVNAASSLETCISGIAVFGKAPATNIISLSDCYAENADGKRQESANDSVLQLEVDGGYTNIETASLTDKSQFPALSFDDVWQITTSAYPTLVWQDDPTSVYVEGN